MTSARPRLSPLAAAPAALAIVGASLMAATPASAAEPAGDPRTAEQTQWVTIADTDTDPTALALLIGLLALVSADLVRAATRRRRA